MARAHLRGQGEPPEKGFGSKGFKGPGVCVRLKRACPASRRGLRGFCGFGLIGLEGPEKTILTRLNLTGFGPCGT